MATRNLPVRLTEEELLHRGQRLAGLEIEIADLEQQKKDSAADFKTKIDLRKADAWKLSVSIESKSENREVEVYEQIVGKIINIVRSDTGEVVDSRPATVDDLQETMFVRDESEQLRKVK